MISNCSVKYFVRQSGLSITYLTFVLYYYCFILLYCIAQQFLLKTSEINKINQYEPNKPTLEAVKTSIVQQNMLQINVNYKNLKITL